MITITHISTKHREAGNCNAQSLKEILEELKPEVIFVEALEETYSFYEQQLYSHFGVSHKKLEIKAIQKYQENNQSVYVPLLEVSLPKEFDLKYDRITQNVDYQKILDEYNEIVAQKGVKYLNTKESTKWQEQLRLKENLILNDDSLNKQVLNGVDVYEDNMIKNMYHYCEKNDFNKGVFLCGVAHRQSLIRKFQKLKKTQQAIINWNVYGE